VIPALSPAPDNPLLVPRSGTAAHGADNVYAPEILRVAANLCLMWFGGQGSDGHDRIYHQGVRAGEERAAQVPRHVGREADPLLGRVQARPRADCGRALSMLKRLMGERKLPLPAECLVP
jgi:hypothetical protein